MNLPNVSLPNLTLLFQMINFGVAYLIMRRLIFAPALKILQTQDSYKKSLEQKIDKAKETKFEVMSQQHSRWVLMQKSLYKLIPQLAQICTKATTNIDQTTLEVAHLSQSEKKSITKLLHEQLLDVKS